MKDIRWLFILVLTVLLGFSIYRVDETWISILIVLVMIVAWYFNDIKEVTMSADKISIKKKEERLDALTNEAEKAINLMYETIDPIIAYNLASLSTEGTFETTDFPNIIEFIHKVEDISSKMGDKDKYHIYLLNARENILYSFYESSIKISEKFKDMNPKNRFEFESIKQTVEYHMDKPGGILFLKEKLLKYDPDNGEYIKYVNELIDILSHYK